MSRPALLLMLIVVLPPVVPAAAEDRSFDSAGVRIRYIDVGPRDGDPVVLIHGGFTNADSWIGSGMIDALDDRYRVIAPDLRGHGKSDKPHDPEAYGPAFAGDIIALMDHLGIERAHIVGYSMGGLITFQMVAGYPERVISCMPNGTDGEPISTAMQRVMEDVVSSLEESGSIRPVLDFFNQDGALSEAQIEEIVELLREHTDHKAMAAMAQRFTEFRTTRSRLEANSVPCRVIIAEHDPNVPALEVTAGYMPNLEIEVLEGTNHLTAAEHPAFIAGVKTFLDRQ